MRRIKGTDQERPGPCRNWGEAATPGSCLQKPALTAGGEHPIPTVPRWGEGRGHSQHRGPEEIRKSSRSCLLLRICFQSFWFAAPTSKWLGARGEAFMKVSPWGKGWEGQRLYLQMPNGGKQRPGNAAASNVIGPLLKSKALSSSLTQSPLNSMSNPSFP